MSQDPPLIRSKGTAPTRYVGQTGKPEQPGIDSLGDLATRFEEQLGKFVTPNMQWSPELLAEQRAVMLSPGDTLAGRFEVVEMLGFGGMGAVYHVKDRHLEEDRALKVMLPSLLEKEAARERFLSEIKISQKLSHDRIVRVHDLGEDNDRGIQFFTMEYIEGKTLHRLLSERGGPLLADEALEIAGQLCDALEYAHRYTIHRDLKPQNIMVRPDGSIKVLDFGLAKLMSPGRLTKSSMALGTAYYQSPEQSINPQELDERADIYSVGVILYQLLTGLIPAGAVKPPSDEEYSVPKAMDEVVMKCLQRRPGDRYDSAWALHEALDNARRHPTRKNGKIAAIASCAVILGLVVAGALVWRAFGSRAETAPDRAQSKEVPIAVARIQPSPSIESRVALEKPEKEEEVKPVPVLATPTDSNITEDALSEHGILPVEREEWEPIHDEAVYSLACEFTRKRALSKDDEDLLEIARLYRHARRCYPWDTDEEITAAVRIINAWSVTYPTHINLRTSLEYLINETLEPPAAWLEKKVDPSTVGRAKDAAAVIVQRIEESYQAQQWEQWNRQYMIQQNLHGVREERKMEQEQRRQDYIERLREKREIKQEKGRQDQEERKQEWDDEYRGVFM